jgi:hypothetical protein
MSDSIVFTQNLMTALRDGLKRRRQPGYTPNSFDDAAIACAIRVTTLHENAVTKRSDFLDGRQTITPLDIHPFTCIQHPAQPLQWILSDMYDVVTATLLHIAQTNMEEQQCVENT